MLFKECARCQAMNRQSDDQVPFNFMYISKIDIWTFSPIVVISNKNSCYQPCENYQEVLLSYIHIIWKVPDTNTDGGSSTCPLSRFTFHSRHTSWCIQPFHWHCGKIVLYTLKISSSWYCNYWPHQEMLLCWQNSIMAAPDVDLLCVKWCRTRRLDSYDSHLAFATSYDGQDSKLWWTNYPISWQL